MDYIDQNIFKYLSYLQANYKWGGEINKHIQSMQARKYCVMDYHNGKTFFFVGDSYYRYDNAADKADDGYPRKISDGWKGVWPSGFDSCYNDGDITYFFKGEEYMTFDRRNDCVFGGVYSIKSKWTNLPFSSIDVAVNGENGKVYFFKGSQYCRVTLATSKVDKDFPYPRPISDGWKGVWPGGIDSATCWSVKPGKMYFFKGNEYIRYDMKGEAVDTGYPTAIIYWNGIPAL